MADKSAGVYDGCGVVSSSGYGDGGYPVYAACNNDSEIDVLEIVYIDEEDDEDGYVDEIDEAEA